MKYESCNNRRATAKQYKNLPLLTFFNAQLLLNFLLNLQNSGNSHYCEVLIKAILQKYQLMKFWQQFRKDDKAMRYEARAYIHQIRMFITTSFFLTKILPKSLWGSKLFENAYKRPLVGVND